MRVSEAWSYSGARAQAWGDCGIAVFQTSGLVRPRTAAALLTDCQDAVARWQCDALVARYSDAHLLIDADAMLQAALTVVGEGGALALPTAIVVKADDMELWRSYCGLMALQGIVRRPFTEHDAALRWARRQAIVFAADRAAGR